MELRILSREAVERYEPQGVEICISITDPAAPRGGAVPRLCGDPAARLQRHRGPRKSSRRALCARSRRGHSRVRGAVAGRGATCRPLPGGGEPLTRSGPRTLRSIWVASSAARGEPPVLESVGAAGAGQPPPIASAPPRMDRAVPWLFPIRWAATRSTRFGKQVGRRSGEHLAPARSAEILAVSLSSSRDRSRSWT